MSRIKPFPGGVNPWSLARLTRVEGATSGRFAAVRLGYRADRPDAADEELTLGLTVDQARTVADLLNEAADLVERAALGGPAVRA